MKTSIFRKLPALSLFFFFLFFLPLAAEEGEASPDPQQESSEGKKSDSKAEAKAADPPTAQDRYQNILEKIHAAEMKRLEERKKVGEDRNRQDMVDEAEEMMKEARERHALALQRLEGAEAEDEEEETKD